jgi:hypothetical protein
MIALGTAAPTFAADPAKEDAPAALFRITSFSDLIADIKYAQSLEQRKQEGLDWEEELHKFTGKNHGGIHINRPAGLLALPKNGDLQPLLLIPIADQQLFLAFVERHLGKPQKDDNGVYSVPFFRPLLFRFAHDYVHVSTEPELVAQKNIRDPAKALASERAGTFIAVFNFERLPKQYKEMPSRLLGINAARLAAANAEPDAQTKLRQQIAASVSRKLNEITNGGREVVLQFGIDRKAGELFAEMNLTPKPDTQLAKDLAALGQGKSRFAAGRGDVPSALRLLLHWGLPEDLTEAVRPTVDEAIRRVMANAAAETEREQAVGLVRAIDPTLRAGEIDAGFHLYGPGKDNRYTLLAGLGVKQGGKIEQAVRSLIKSLPERDRDKFKFNAARAGSVPVHRADVQYDFGESLSKMFGNSPVYFTIHDDAVWLALGPEALGALKEALAAKPQAVVPLDYELTFARLAALVPGGPAAAKQLFKKGGDDRARFAIEGGKTLRVRLNLQAPVVTFLTKTRDQPGRPLWLYWWW